MLLVAAPDKFRGTASAAQVAAAMAAAGRGAGWTCRELPLADGGEGTVDAFGGPNRRTRVTGPLGGTVEAPWRLCADGTAVMEMASASGLDLVGGKDGNDPVAASTMGTGELIAAAVDAGAGRIIVGIGGSATTDGGLGAVEVLTSYAPLDGTTGPHLLVACDVSTLFVDAASIFGPQKGATSAHIPTLGRRLIALVDHYRDRYGVNVAELAGSGGAGGLGGGLAALGARLVPGFDLIAAERGLAAAIADADLVVTGEGQLDAQSLVGKVVGGVAEAAGTDRTAGVVGAVAAGVTVPFPVLSLVEAYGRDRAFTDTLGCVSEATTRLVQARGD